VTLAESLRNELVDRQASQFARRVAEQRTCLGVGQDDLAFLVYQHERVWHTLQQRCVLRDQRHKAGIFTFRHDDLPRSMG